jgi:Sap, sulfolipid-1-addressing protein
LKSTIPVADDLLVSGERSQLSSWEDYLALVYFCVLATASYILMEIYAAVRPDETQDFLARVRQWIDAHTDQLIVWLSLVVGLWLVGKSIYLIVT